MGTEGVSLKAAAPKDREAELTATVADEETGAAAAPAVLFFFFFFPFFVVEGDGGAGKNSTSAAGDSEKATGDANDEGSECSDGGADPNRSPDEENTDSPDIFFRKERAPVNTPSKPKNSQKE